jgi:hypothetical protein
VSGSEIPQAVVEALDQVRIVQAGEGELTLAQAVGFVRAALSGIWPDEDEFEVLAKLRQTIIEQNPDGPEFVVLSYMDALDAVEKGVRRQPVWTGRLAP